MLNHTVLLPAAYESGKRYPAVIALHGLGGNETNMLPVLEGFRQTHLIILVRGDLPFNGGHAYFYIKSYGNPDRETFASAVDGLTAFIDEAVSLYPIDSARIFLVGFSQGAILSMALSLLPGARVKGVVALNGYIPAFVLPEAPELVQTAYFVAQGERDPLFGPEVGMQNRAVLVSRSGDVTYTEYPVAHEITPAMVADLTTWVRTHS